MRISNTSRHRRSMAPTSSSQSSCQLSSFIIVLCIVSFTGTSTTTITSIFTNENTFTVDAFITPSNGLLSPSTRTAMGRWLLPPLLARRNGHNASSGNKKRKSNINSSKRKDPKNKGAKINKRNNTNSSNSNKSSSSSNTSKVLPPWQIMSTKDVKKNIESEKQRREAIRNGEIASSVTSSTDKVGNVSASSSLLSLTDRELYTWRRFNPDKDVAGMKFTGAYLGKQLPPQMGCPEVAFLGRSNVGKSSLLNKLVKKVSDGGGGGGGSGDNSSVGNDSARVGKTPGATASVNIYSIQGKGKNKNRPLMGFADLPGFGYAKLSKDVKESVEMAAERYLGKRRELALGILLVDVRRVPSDDDRAVLAALYDMGVPLLVVATKVDKIKSQNSLSAALEEVRIGLGLPQGQPFHISSMTGEGVKQLWGIIMDACEDKIEELKEEQEGKRNDYGQKLTDDEYIMLDDEGNFIEEAEPTAEGLEWVRNFAYYDESKESTKAYEPSEAAMIKMKQNEMNQAAANDAMKLRSLRKEARKMERKGQI